MSNIEQQNQYVKEISFCHFRLQKTSIPFNSQLMYYYESVFFDWAGKTKYKNNLFISELELKLICEFLENLYKSKTINFIKLNLINKLIAPISNEYWFINNEEYLFPVSGQLIDAITDFDLLADMGTQLVSGEFVPTIIKYE